ncbi:hypothetical protein D4764_18G0002560 [Takifugu flavidus]|uniref:Uncharacterized protein n=1 Tax=Takifugu flavidus TaxID=433684 RepID=A0A5C6NTM1_9TELE|nr:hypothetical protein D4764_18G0002560 [Takifugu flavidus]
MRDSLVTVRPGAVMSTGSPRTQTACDPRLTERQSGCAATAAPRHCYRSAALRRAGLPAHRLSPTSKEVYSRQVAAGSIAFWSDYYVNNYRCPPEDERSRESRAEGATAPNL